MPDFGSVPADRPQSGFGNAFVTGTAGRFIGANHAVRSAATVSLARMYCAPLWVPQTTTYDRISCELTTSFAATGVIRLGIFANDSSTVDLPGAVVLDAGTTDSTVAPARLDITISQQLTPGLYWLAYVSQVTATTGQVRQGTWQTSAAMPVATPEGASLAQWPYMSSVTGALTTFSFSGFTPTVPLVWLRQA